MARILLRCADAGELNCEAEENHDRLVRTARHPLAQRPRSKGNVNRTEHLMPDVSDGGTEGLPIAAFET